MATVWLLFALCFALCMSECVDSDTSFPLTAISTFAVAHSEVIFNVTRATGSNPSVSIRMTSSIASMTSKDGAYTLVVKAAPTDATAASTDAAAAAAATTQPHYDAGFLLKSYCSVSLLAFIMFTLNPSSKSFTMLLVILACVVYAVRADAVCASTAEIVLTLPAELGCNEYNPTAGPRAVSPIPPASCGAETGRGAGGSAQWSRNLGRFTR